ncbi:MAG TPA: protein translocase subunit SecD, partial [Phycisphaerae bacterium]|nr:protein translocase subunit SecD [Phycisphaerae bacterium]
MNERDLWWKIALVGTLCALAFGSIWPMDQKLKYGIDLYGGYSLLYEIDDSGLSGADKNNLSERVMRVLRERVDPKGVFNLVWRPVGHNRLEIQMPRPSKEITAARDKFKNLREHVLSTQVRRSDVMRALGKQGPDRTAAFEKLVRGLGNRTLMLETAAKAYDEWKTAEDSYEKRVKQAEADNLTRADVEAAVKKPFGERIPAMDSLVRGVPQRRLALDEAAKAWDEVVKLQPTTQPAGSAKPDAVKAYDDKLAAFDKAVAKVLDANVDPNKSSEGVTIDQVVALEEKLDNAVGAIMATNLDVGRLQSVLDARPTDPTRDENKKKLESDYPGLASMIDDMVKSNDDVKKQQRRNEGRLEDPADLQRLLRGAGVLEFRILAEADPSNPEKYTSYREALKSRGPRRAPGEENYQWFAIEDVRDFLKMQNPDKEFEARKKAERVVVERFGDKYYVLANIGEGYTLTHKAGEKDWTLKGAHPDRDESGRPAIAFQLDELGGDKFSTLTRLNKGHLLCIFLDDQAISQATIQSVIRTQGRITGNFKLKEVQEMCKKLEAGSLPKKLKDPPISVRSIGPSLGEANRSAGLRSAKIASIAVAAFMIVYYYYAGTIAVIATVMNILFTLAAMAVLGATLTLPGIAGLVLAVGMAVDANVLINERIREELTKGTAMRMAIKLGYERAFSAILDSHVTTILTSLILYLLGSEEVKGFGLTLGVGVVINLFTSYFVTRMFFEMMAMFGVPSEVKRYPWVFAAGVSAFGALVYALGYWRNEPAVRDQSVAILFGQSLMYVGPGVILLLGLMWMARSIHQAVQHGKSRLPMQHWIGVPRWNWIAARYYLFAFSIVLTAGGLYLFAKVPTRDLYDIEFLGGTAAEIDLKTPGSLNAADVSQRLAKSGETLRRFSDAMRKASVEGGGGVFTVKHPGVPADRLEPMIKSVFDKDLSQLNPVMYSDPAAEVSTIQTKSESKMDLDAVKSRINVDLADALKRAGDTIANAQVQGVQALGPEAQEGRSFEIVTLEKNKDVVVSAIMENLQKDLDIQPKLTFNIVYDKNGNTPYFPIKNDDAKKLDLPLSAAELANLDLQGWKGGVAILLDQISPPQRLDVLKGRLRSMRLQPGFESHGWRESDVFGLQAVSGSPDQFSKVLVVVADENYPLDEQSAAVSSAWASELAEPEVALVKAALTRQTSLAQITQFDEQVSNQAKQNAYIAIVLSWLMIIIYLWFRFG